VAHAVPARELLQGHQEAPRRRRRGRRPLGHRGPSIRAAEQAHPGPRATRDEREPPSHVPPKRHLDAPAPARALRGHERRRQGRVYCRDRGREVYRLRPSGLRAARGLQRRHPAHAGAPGRHIQPPRRNENQRVYLELFLDQPVVVCHPCYPGGHVAARVEGLRTASEALL